MYCVRKVTEDLYWVGANDHRLHLFENIHPIPYGVSYNAYLLMDQETVLFDTVDWSACRQLLENLDHVLEGRSLDWLVVNHMEPDHGACVEQILLRYPEVKVISTEKSFMLMRQFGFHPETHECVTVAEGDTHCFGTHTVTFVEAPMVHWPEAMVTFDTTNGALFSADAFGSFIALDGKLFADEVDFDRDWLDEARRYEPEVKGVMIAYASMYGNTEGAAQALAGRLCEKGCTNVAVYDVSNTHVSYLISEAFKYSHIVLGSVTYNLGIYPVMHNFLMDMKALNLQKRTFALIENGSWACKSGDLMQKFIEEELKDMTLLNERLSMASSMGPDKNVDLDALADAIMESMKE